MLDTETKRRIDTARDILVGKVPDPKSQVEQITIALIYKFMDDMDAEAEELGGKRKFFKGEFAAYGWAKLMEKAGNDKLRCYADGIARMTENEGLPALFRDIFKNAYLPYRDPETLNAFLKIINEFRYDHSERLGDAFEYLLSVLGSQGDAGQFRTPRHIIDFMVEILKPQKHETVLDPACGTAGFLISAYKHILRSNRDAKGNSKLTPDDKGKLAKNFKGYDISPDMVRLSLVNLYLHGFTDPHIYEYDSLTQEERWNELADVILANPPFMSPKGGIRPHKRFSIQAKRSEVLFVDYMAEHLTAQGRAGIIVPEGIIFQSQTAYVELRKMLVDTCLVAVISLPAGCFNPYSGVKTSILLLDKALAKQSDTIAFFKVENDGFGLGAQRRAIEQNDLPQVQTELEAYLQGLRVGTTGARTLLSASSTSAASPASPSSKATQGLTQPDAGPSSDGGQECPRSFTTAFIVQKSKVAANGDYNLSGERYREANAVNHKWPEVELGSVARLINGRAYKQEELLAEGPTPVLRVGNFFSNRGWYYSDLELEPDKYCEPGDLLFAWSASFGPRIWDGPRAIYHYHIWKVEPTEAIDKMFLFHLLAAEAEKIKSEGHGIAMVHATKGGMEKRKFPLPPLEVQKEIVAEIEGYQKVIDGARAVLDHYRPHIPIHPDWPIVEIGTVSTIVRGSSPRPQGDPQYFGGPVPRLMVADITRDGMYATPQIDSLTELGATKSRPMKKGDVIITVSGNPGLPTILAIDACIHDGFVGLRDLSKDVLPEYLYFALLALHSQHGSLSVGAVFKNLTTDQIREFKIALPPIETQRAIVSEIEAEQALVAANRELITRMEAKIQATLARVWGEEAAAAA